MAIKVGSVSGCNGILKFLGVVTLVGMAAGCASTPLVTKVGTWQNERPYATKIKTVRDSGRRLRKSDVDLVFTMADFKKDLPDCSATIESVTALGKTALNIVSELGNTASPLYVAAVDSVDRKWAMYVGRDVEAEAGGDIKKYLESVEPEYREQVKKDYDAYQKIVKYVPDPAILQKGKGVCERYLTTGEDGAKTLDVMAIEMLQYTGKQNDSDDYNAFIVYRDNTPEVQKMYDDAVMAKLKVLAARIQAEQNDLLAAAQKLREDPEVSKLNLVDMAKTIKAVGGGIGRAFADPTSKVNKALSGYSLASDIEKLAKNTQKAEQTEANKAKKD